MKNINLKNKSSAGFTLVETLLYVAIVSTLIFLMSAFLLFILESRTKFQTISEVENQGIQVMNIITQIIRDAEIVTLPVPGTSATSVTLDVTDIAKDPTIFNSLGGNIQIKEGAGAIIPLTSSRVLVSDLSFENISRNNTPGIIRFNFTLSYNSDSNRNEYNYSRTFYGSAALR
jgi:Tfp pilus assembly protein PilW